jgi:BMFP domain-containing protein YqiC
MPTRSRMFDDAAKLAGGAVGALDGVRREMESLICQQVERVLSKFDLVKRDEFEAVKEMAVRARSEQENIVEKLKSLEASQRKPRKGQKAGRRKTPKAK